MSVYPLCIGGISSRYLSRPDQRSPIGGQAAIDCPLLGSVDVDPMSESDPILKQIAKVCHGRGFALNDRHPGPYGVRDYTFGAGSVPSHVDSGMGLTLGVLVATMPLSRGLAEQAPSGNCYLVTKASNLEVSLGDVFVFDANKEHAWISNCRWVLAIHSVRRLRSKK